MSYILDAIKKSDQQRDLGTAPSVHTLHEPPMIEEPSRRPGWLYGLAAILLLNAGGLGWWLWHGTPTKTPVAQAPASSVVAKVAPQPSPPTAGSGTLFKPSPPSTSPATPPASKSPFVLANPPKPAAVSTPPPPAPAAKPVAVTANQGSAITNIPTTSTPPPIPAAAPVIATPKMSPPVTAGTKKPTSSPKVAFPGTKAPSTTVVPVQTPIITDVNPEESLDEIETSPATDTENVPEIAASSDLLSPIAASASPKSNNKKTAKDEEDPEISKIPFLNKLPPEIQQGIPEMHISFHSYSIKASARLVSISGKILREGDSFDTDVKLETITTKGVIMKVKDRRFQLKVNPSSRL